MSISKKQVESIKSTEKDSILDKEDVDREGINTVYGIETFDSDSESDKAEADYEGTIKFDNMEWSDEGQEVRIDLDDED